MDLTNVLAKIIKNLCYLSCDQQDKEFMKVQGLHTFTKKEDGLYNNGLRTTEVQH